MGNCVSGDSTKNETPDDIKVVKRGGLHLKSLDVSSRSTGNITYETEQVTEYTDDHGKARVNQYVMMEVLGKGSYGVVKRVLNTRDDKYYAMKIFSKKNLQKRTLGRRTSITNQLASVLKEVAVMKKLHHPNVVDLVEVLDDSDAEHLCIVIQLVGKGSILPGSNEVKPFSEEKCRKYFRELILGLEYLHSQHVLHRDLKPENILLTNDDHIKISDFGMAFPYENDDLVATTAGTAAFMAPEMCSADGDSFSGTKVDIWALGASLYVMLFGNVPFGDPSGNSWDIYEAIIKNPLVFPKKIKISKHCRDLLRKVMDKNQKTRIPLAKIRKHPWVTKNGADPLAEQKCTKERLVADSGDVSLAITPVSKIASLATMKAKMHRKLNEARKFIESHEHDHS